ncbi:MAG: hypothetical protein JNK23_16120 [Opitutaceae bacterium]|nr:hypothetical protein [Opitutaceae bacterium]
MKIAATVVAPLAAVLLLGACRTVPAKPASILAEDALFPSPRLIVGRVLSHDAAQGIVIVELAGDAPPGAATDGAELMARTAELRETARLRASRVVRGRILGTQLVSGQPAPGDEVVWLVP